MNTKYKRTLEAIFHEPVRSDVKLKEIKNLLIALGAEISEGRGSRVRVALKGVRAVFHRPHTQKVTDKGDLKSVKRFLITAGVKNDI